jgi:Domain of unknown function (DUF4349)
MKPFENENELTTALRELRPQPQPQFAAELDAWAAVGFPRRSPRRSAWGSLRERLASTPPRRLIAPAGALAVAAVVIATAVVSTSDSGDPGRTESNLLSKSTPADTSAGGDAAEQGTLAEPARKAAAGGEGAATALPSKPSGPYASQAGRRDVERSAEMVLGTDPTEVRSAAAKVFDTVHAADGIVLSSSIRDGEAGDAGADFELLIPSAKLGDALASISRIAEVRSRNETTQDITAPTVSTGEKLQDSRAKIEGLLGQLAGVDTDEERAAVEAQLRSERYRAAALRSRLSALDRRANFSRVQLRIETGEPSSSSDEGGGGGWGVGDGLDDAGRILAVAAGVTVIGLAILAPFALIGLLAWLSRRAWIRQARTRALSRP